MKLEVGAICHELLLKVAVSDSAVVAQQVCRCNDVVGDCGILGWVQSKQHGHGQDTHGTHHQVDVLEEVTSWVGISQDLIEMFLNYDNGQVSGRVSIKWSGESLCDVITHGQLQVTPTWPLVQRIYGVMCQLAQGQLTRLGVQSALYSQS